jgi:hypothetical protein
MVKSFLLRVATYRQFPLPVRFNDYENRELVENGGSWTRNVCTTHIANQGQPIEWSNYFSSVAPPAADSPLSAFCDFQKRYYLGNGESWMR